MARGRPKEIVNEEVIKRARAELKVSADYRVGMRLQAIVSCADHPLEVVSSILGVSRQTVWRWIKRFKEEGIKGLHDRPKGHNPSKLSPDQKEQIKGWLERGSDSKGVEVHWTLARLMEEVRREFGVSIAKTPLWVMIRKMGIRQKVQRSHHAKAERVLQEPLNNNRGEGG